MGTLRSDPDVFEELPKKKTNFYPLQNQTIILNFEMTDFNNEITEIEAISGFKSKKYQKVLIYVALKRLRGNKYSYTYKDNDFELRLDFDFKHILCK